MSTGDLWRDRNKVFVAGLPAYVDDTALAAKFRPFGEMFQSKVVYDNSTGKSKGFGFITFCDYANALEAVANLNQSKWDNRVLNVRFLKPKSDNASDNAQQQSQQLRAPKVFGPCPPGCVSIYVGNLSYNITEQVLRKVFAACGDIKAVRFAEHMKTKEFRGFGHVQFYESAACEKAIALDGTIVMGRPMNVDYGSRDEATEKLREDLQRKLKKGVCHKFQAGECTRGDDCKFAHIPNTPAGGVAPVVVPVAAAQQPVPVVASDVPICLSFQKGKCKRGDSCKFQHMDPATATANETDISVSASANTTSTEEGETASTVPVCQSFNQGKCKRGDKCRFRHVALPEQDQEMLPASVDNHHHHQESAAPVPEEDETPVCLNYQKGTCKRGAACRFRHVDGSTSTESAVVEKEEMAPTRLATAADDDAPICQNYLKGKCKRGAACRFQHVDAASVPEPPVVVVPTISICQNFQRGRCTRGTSCRFAHTMESADATEAAPVAAPVAIVPAAAVTTAHSDYQKRFQSVCYNWQNARSCVRGDQCPFFHEGGSSSTTATATRVEKGGMDDDAAHMVKKEKKSKKRKSADDDDDSDTKKKKKAKKEMKQKETSDSDSE